MVTIPQPITALADREQRIAMTYDEFLARVSDSLHAEWINGVVVIFMPPNDRHQALVRTAQAYFLTGDEERAEVVCNLVERIVDCPDFRTPGAGRNGCIDQFVMEAGHDHRLVHAIGGKRIELPI